jgi:hypothetical protein
MGFARSLVDIAATDPPPFARDSALTDMSPPCALVHAYQRASTAIHKTLNHWKIFSSMRVERAAQARHPLAEPSRAGKM